MDVLGPF